MEEVHLARLLLGALPSMTKLWKAPGRDYLAAQRNQMAHRRAPPRCSGAKTRNPRNLHGPSHGWSV
uniref:Uncharacterized protein n=1 Tax=Anopheles atroparvus TaxID=41427 RepID=A0AAG5DK53_ANOAO